MFKKIFMWKKRSEQNETNKDEKSLFLEIFYGIIEDVFYWRNSWFSLLFILNLHLIFFVVFYRQHNLLQILCGIFIFILCVDALEIWLKYKHRTTCLKRLAQRSGSTSFIDANEIYIWTKTQISHYIELREANPTKAFLIMKIVFSILFLFGKYMSGYVLFYILFISIVFLNKYLPPIKSLILKIHHTSDCDTEFEGLVPDASQANLDLLTLETDFRVLSDEKQSLDDWNPHDLPMEDVSDSSDNSSSLVTNISMEKLNRLDKDVDVSDSSDEDYIPKDQHIEQIQTTLDIQPQDTWTSSAYNALSTLGGAVSNIVYRHPEENKRKRFTSNDSSDGFEMIDKNDVM
ncbi:uncharacterized protein LOC126965065 isoform X2 [Leptidea sinapis]|uniref:uncharacterized protein LOC126965065 isoform X2 n=1 Tax=Leptidea sinapis TaxID=189913 RepID=UPI0021C25B9C|nr:uncharacterized protein LOC126965065 isoform X2 [Leptidea sinapis]